MSANTSKPKVPSSDISVRGFASRDKESLKKVTIQFGQRLHQIRIDNKLTQKEIAKSLHLNAMTYSRYENGTRIPDADICAQIVLTYGIDPAWLLFGDQCVKKNTATKPVSSNYTTAPVYELADAGHANYLTQGSPVDEISVPINLLHEHIAVIVYRDSNMTPYISPGAIVGLNTDIKDTPMGHVYAIWAPHTGTMLYRTYPKNLTEIALRSDNPTMPDLTVTHSDFKQAVLGKVEWLFQTA
jgi:transcriptional regulator with XRE-family HTH domain